MQVKWIEASAGCGKTSFLLNSYKLSPGNSLFITFSKAAAEELKFRLSDSSVKVMTLHSFAYEILKLYKPINKLTGKFLTTQALAILLKDKPVFQLFEWLNKNSDGVVEKKEIAEVNLDKKEPVYRVEMLDCLYDENLMERKQLDEIKALFFTKQDTLRKKICIPSLSPDLPYLQTYILDSIERIDLHERFLEKYVSQVKNQLYDLLLHKEEDLKYSLGVVYYDDLVKEVSKLIKKSGEILFPYIGNIKSIYIDEAQDLSRDQLELVFDILNEWKVLGGELFVAGDPKQLIYDFQGASIGEFKKFKNRLISISSVFNEVKLNVTHRLAKGLCDFVNKVGKDLDIDYVEHFTKKEVKGSVRVIKLEEYDDILNYVTNDTMILFKQKSPVIESLALKMMKKGFLLNSPYIVAHPIIKDFQHLIRWLAYNNTISLAAIFNSFGKSGLTLEELMEQPEIEFLNSLTYADLSELFLRWIAFDPLDSFLRSKLKFSFDFFIDVLRKYAEFYRFAPYEAIFDLDDFFASNSNLFDGGIFLNTIHSSKGKEANRVILIDTDKKTKFKNDTDRLMYVALTRAKEELLIPILRDSYINTWAELLVKKAEDFS